MDVGMGAILDVLRTEQPFQDALRQFKRVAAHVADNKVSVRGTSGRNCILYKVVGGFDIHYVRASRFLSCSISSGVGNLRK